MNMTEPAPNNQEPTPEKLLIDDPSNFPFHAAYVVYSEVFDSAGGDDAKRELNMNIEDLKNNVISPETFYRNISRFRRDAAPNQRYDRFTVQTQRKRDWRVKSQRQERIRRHKK
jgi:hypothetical protein